MSRRISGAIALIVVALAAVATTLVLLEGLASVVVAAGLLLGSSGRLAQERYARYDPDLGWSSLPDIVIPDMYGPGVGLHTNALGFRGRVLPSPAPPPDKVRVVCSGDSFTFGYGVDDDDAWCAQLGRLDPRLEPINMGQGGYGVDQAFLWYRRDGARLAPALHLFAFIDGDFERMRTPRFLDYGKPTLALRNGTLAVENVPAPHRPFWMPPVRVLDVVKRTKSYELVDRLRQRFVGTPSALPAMTEPPATAARTALADVALAVFHELRTIAARHGGALVLVYLPTATDCRLPLGTPTGLDWWRSIGPRARSASFEVVDLSDDCRRLPASELDGLFFPEGALQYYGAAGHYTTAGNRFVANTLIAKLRPLIAAAAAHRPDYEPIPVGNAEARGERSPSESRRRSRDRGGVASGYAAQGGGEHAARSRVPYAAAGVPYWDRL
jgi:hypothetical protein